MPKYKLVISYDGTDYIGWQVQNTGSSIQGLIEQALYTFLKYPVRVIGSGRTDAGVHAQAQVAHFVTDALLDPPKTQRALNGMLPHNIRIHTLERTEDTFHAIYSARKKEYHYHLWLDAIISPFVRRYRHHIPYPFDIDLLKASTTHFIGEHDFATFANKGSLVKTTIRTIYRIDVVEQPGGLRLEFEGNGFLYKMVRNIMGTCIEVATHKRKIDQIARLLKAKDRRLAGIAAPARGLFLVNVDYAPCMKKVLT